MSDFIAQNGRVYIVGAHPPAELKPDVIERLLTAFDEAKAHRPYNDLHEAYVAAGGVPRISSLREAA